MDKKEKILEILNKYANKKNGEQDPTKFINPNFYVKEILSLFGGGETKPYSNPNGGYGPEIPFNTMKPIKKIICKTCYLKIRADKEDWCKIIENEDGGSMKADRTECPYYIERGKEPKWKCCKCGKNTYAEHATSENKKWYCEDCWWIKESLELKKSELEKYRKNIEAITKILGGNKKLAKKIMKEIK